MITDVVVIGKGCALRHDSHMDNSINFLSLRVLFLLLFVALSQCACSTPRDLDSASAEVLVAIYNNDLKGFSKAIGDVQSENAPNEYIRKFLLEHHKLFVSKGELSAFKTEIGRLHSAKIISLKYENALIFDYDPEYTYYYADYIFPRGGFYSATFYRVESGDYFLLLPLINFENDSSDVSKP